MVLETDFETEDGAVTIVDFMPRPNDHVRMDLVRLVVGRRGSVPMRLELVLRFDYGRNVPWVRRRDYGLTAVAGPDAVQLVTPSSEEHKSHIQPLLRISYAVFCLKKK